MRAKYFVLLKNYDNFYIYDLSEIANDDVELVIDVYKKKITFNLIDWEIIGWRG